MPPKRKPENRGLPVRWQFIHGAYYFRVPPGLESLWDGKQTFRLGKTLSDAYKVWADRLGAVERTNTIAQLLDRYLLEVVPTKAPKTQIDNVQQIKKLRAVFGKLRLVGLKPQMVYEYVSKRTAKVAAHREIEVLSHAFTKAVEWGYLDRHPFKGEVRLKGESARDRYVEDWEIVECLALPSKRKKGSVQAIQASIRIKLLTGMARGDLLRLEPARHFKEDGIHIQRHKTASSSGKRTIYEWTTELRAAVDMALAARPVDIAPWLFCTRFGKCYINEEKGTAKGWDSMWQDFMARILKETKVTERFTEHDLRAKCASDAESLEHARALLSHADGRLTERIYRRKPERVKPLR
jgi:integrase